MGSDITQIGLGVSALPDGWSLVAVGDVAALNEVSIQSDYAYDSIEYIDISTVERGSVGPTQVVPLNEAPSRARRVVRDNDTIIATVRPNLEHYAFIRRARPNLVASTGFAVVSAKRADPRFIYYYLTTRQFTNYLTRIADSHTSAYPAFNSDVIKHASILLPPIPEQRAIAHILGTLDDKIELNRRMSETLEDIVRALFKSWFVDFDPVRARAEDRDPGLPRHIADLFPDRLEDSRQGEVPEGWGVMAVSDVIEVNPPRYLKKGDIASYLDMANMPTKGHRAIDVVRRPFGSGSRFSNGDTLLARITPCLENGKTAFVDFLSDGQTGWGSTEYIVLRPRPPLPPEFGYYLARDDGFRGHVIQNMTGTSGRQRAPASCLEQYSIAVPPAPLGVVFGGIARSMMARIRLSDEEAGNLANLRDALLPKLISGELQISDADRFLREAVT